MIRMLCSCFLMLVCVLSLCHNCPSSATFIYRSVWFSSVSSLSLSLLSAFLSLLSSLFFLLSSLCFLLSSLFSTALITPLFIKHPLRPIPFFLSCYALSVYSLSPCSVKHDPPCPYSPFIYGTLSLLCLPSYIVNPSPLWLHHLVVLSLSSLILSTSLITVWSTSSSSSPPHLLLIFHWSLSSSALRLTLAEPSSPSSIRFLSFSSLSVLCFLSHPLCTVVGQPLRVWDSSSLSLFLFFSLLGRTACRLDSVAIVEELTDEHLNDPKNIWGSFFAIENDYAEDQHHGTKERRKKKWKLWLTM